MNIEISDTQPFLEKSHPYNDESFPSSSGAARGSTATRPVPTTPKQKLINFSRALIQSPILFLLNICLITGNFFFSRETRRWLSYMKEYCPDLPQSPTITGIRYETLTMDLGAYNPYGGDFGPEVDRAWDGLMNSSVFRATKEEMIQWGEWGDDSIELENGGYLAGLRVYHELHCMDWFKRSYANPNVTIDPAYEAEHLGVMCRSDLATSSWYLGPDNVHKPLIERTHAEHLCVHWESVENWLKPRALVFTDGVPEPARGPNGGLVSQEDLATNAMPH